MTSTDRFRLLSGPYRTPRFKYGDIVMDEVRDCEVVFIGSIADRFHIPRSIPFANNVNRW